MKSQQTLICPFLKTSIDPAYAKAADAGQFYTMDNPYIAKAIEALEQI